MQPWNISRWNIAQRHIKRNHGIFHDHFGIFHDFDGGMFHDYFGKFYDLMVEYSTVAQIMHLWNIP